MKNLRTGTAKFDTIRAKDASGLHIQDDAGNGLFIKDGGNVGIGTTSPDKLFHVETNDTSTNAIAKFKNAGDGDATLQIGNATTNFVIGMDNSDSDKFKLGYGDALESITGMTIDSSANVGIGTTNPVYNLQVQASTPIVSIVSNVDSSSRLNLFERIGSGQSLGAFIKYNGTTNALELGNTVNDSDAVNISVSRVSGNVGIGTTIPSAKLHIENTTGSSLILQSLGSYADGHQPVIILAGKNPSEVNKNLARIRAASEGTELGALAFDVRMGAGTPHEEAMRIDSDGNVGIGTTNPSHVLTLGSPTNTGTTSSSLKIYRGADDAGQNLEMGFNHITVTRDANALADPQSTFSIRQKGSDGERTVMHVDVAGNVGIGTLNPGAKLEIAEPQGSPQLLINNNATSFNSASIKFISGGTGNPVSLIESGGTSTDRQGLFFSTGLLTGSVSPRMCIDSVGNVGIGTTNPSSKLTAQIADNTAYANETPDAVDSVVAVVNNPTAEAVNNHSSLHFNLNAGTHNHVASISLVSESASLRRGALAFCTDNGTTRPEAVRIDSNGRVGIGTTSPDKPLEIAQSDGTSGIRLNYIPSTYPNNYLADIYHDGANGLILESKLGSATIGGDILLAPNGGNVGIGITDPGSYKLNVNGTASVVHSVNGSQEVTSDDRVKHNEQPIIGALETLSKITPKKYIKTTEMYDANHDFELDADGNPINENGEPVEHRIEAGVIAQQVLTVDELAFTVSPEDVDEDGVVTSPHGLDYNSLFTYAIAAIQEQQEIIETQNSRIDELISRIETLEQ